MPSGFVRELEDVQLDDVGLEAAFECEVTKPELKAEWFVGTKQIKTSDKYRMTSKNGVHTLTITDCQSEDVAKYTIKLNGISSSAKLSVNGIPITIVINVCLIINNNCISIYLHVSVVVLLILKLFSL